MNGYFKSESGKVKAERGSTRWVYNNFLRKQTKLRWVCGLCNVWCKDENGFKCHLEHPNHIRKSEISRQSKAPDFKMSPRDEAFAASFVQYLAQNYLNRKVLLHEVYREMYPDDKFQRLMHDTCWGSLGTFINALSKNGECEAVKGPKGWVVRIDQDMLIAAEEEKEGREATLREDLGDEDDEDLGEASCFLAQDDATIPEVPESRSKKMQASWAATLNQPAPKKPRMDDGGARRAAALAREAQAQGMVEDSEATALGSAERGKVAFQMSKASKASKVPGKAPGTPGPKDGSQLAEQTAVTSVPWPPGLVVKVLCTKALEGKASGLKAVTMESTGSIVQVRLLKPVDGKENLVIAVNHERLETVLPKLGSRVLILGDGEGTLQSVQTQSFSCTVQIGSLKVSGLPYEKVCKIAG
eukprot:Skav231522  [mRNA]  locus=scaffold84:649530:650771:- [translate_table: standard]